MCRRSVLWIYSTSSVKQANTWMRVVYNAASAQLRHNCADLNKHLLMTSTHYSPWAPDTSMTKYSETPRYHRPGTRECQEPCGTHPLDRDTWSVRHNITQNNGKSEYTVIGSNKYDTINLHPSLELPRTLVPVQIPQPHVPILPHSASCHYQPLWTPRSSLHIQTDDQNIQLRTVLAGVCETMTIAIGVSLEAALSTLICDKNHQRTLELNCITYMWKGLYI
jgi:hypothetical protein